MLFIFNKQRIMTKIQWFENRQNVPSSPQVWRLCNHTLYNYGDWKRFYSVKFMT